MKIPTNIDPTLMQNVSNWIGLIQEALGRRADSPSDDFLAEHATNGVE